MLSLFGADHGALADLTHRPDAMGLKPIRAYKLATLVDQVLAGRTQDGAERGGDHGIANRKLRGYRILLVEDNPVNQRVAQRLLQKMAAEVILANNGAEALERVAEGGFDAVLMDCQMPVMDGFTAAARIREPRKRTADRASACPSSH